MKSQSYFKIKYQNFCKYIPIPKSLEDLVLSIKKSFDFPEKDLFSLSYKDEEEDIISILDSSDFYNLIKYSKTQDKIITIQISSEEDTKESLKSIHKINIYQGKKTYFIEELNNIYKYLLNALISPFKKKLSSNILNKRLSFNTKNNNDSYTINLNLVNNGQLNWPCPSFLKCLENSNIFGNSIKISKEIEPSNTIEVKVKLDLSNIKESGKYISMFQLFDEKANSFGDIFTISINCIFDNELKIKPEIIEVYDSDNINPITTDEFLMMKGYNFKNNLKKVKNNDDEIYNKYYD